MCQEIPVGNFTATKDEKGNWIYKASETSPLLKKENPKYREEPQFPLQYQIEGNAKATFKKNINKAIVQIIKFIK